ncbi:MAG TPA: MBOAT family protein [Vicinamibacterales bacterium]|nr:MBOAT family protein [Vicinamibacterales bacterium]
MLFTDPTFLFVFLPLLLALYYAGRGSNWHNWLLLGASVLFYAMGAGSFTALVLTSIVFNYVAALGVDRFRGTATGTWILRAAVTVNLIVLLIFKYADFAIGNVNVALALFGTRTFALPHLLLPIGISFFTFHAISYVVDVYRRDASAQKRPVEAALYLLVFPQLIAGPIVRYRQIATQLTARVTTLDDFAVGVRRFIVGLGKKMLIANTVAAPADRIFSMPADQLTAAHAWLAVVCYTLQIYFDFSGYSDMAIGLGRMFGFHFPENFNYPYIASSVQDFWRRWHMSLSAWFRDYVYIPLGGNRTSTSRLYFNLVLVFFLCGLWHGANWTFVIWGLFHGAFLVLERVGLASRLKQLAPAARHAYLLLVVMVGWVFFRAETFGAAIAMLRAMAGLGAAMPSPYTPAWYLTPEVTVALVMGAIGAMPVLPQLQRWREAAADPGSRATGTWEFAATAALLLVLVGAIAQSAATTYNPFIYFRF